MPQQGFDIRLATAERQQLKTLLLQFPQTDDGKKFTSLSGVANLRDLPAAEQTLLDAFVEQTRAGLSGGK